MPRKYGVPQRDRVRKHNIMGLSPQLRQVVALRCAGRSHREVSEIMGLSQKTVTLYWREALDRIPDLMLEGLSTAQQLAAVQRWWEDVGSKAAATPH